MMPKYMLNKNLMQTFYGFCQHLRDLKRLRLARSVMP
jgi:hypothetical protein